MAKRKRPKRAPKRRRQRQRQQPSYAFDGVYDDDVGYDENPRPHKKQSEPAEPEESEEPEFLFPNENHQQVHAEASDSFFGYLASTGTLFGDAVSYLGSLSTWMVPLPPIQLLDKVPELRDDEPELAVQSEQNIHEPSNNWLPNAPQQNHLQIPDNHKKYGAYEEPAWVPSDSHIHNAMLLSKLEAELESELAGDDQQSTELEAESTELEGGDQQSPEFSFTGAFMTAARKHVDGFIPYARTGGLLGLALTGAAQSLQFLF